MPYSERRIDSTRLDSKNVQRCIVLTYRTCHGGWHLVRTNFQSSLDDVAGGGCSWRKAKPPMRSAPMEGKKYLCSAGAWLEEVLSVRMKMVKWREKDKKCLINLFSDQCVSKFITNWSISLRWRCVVVLKSSSRRSRPRSHRKRTVTQTRRANVMLCRVRAS